MDKNTILNRMWRMGWAVFMLTCLLIWLFGHYQQQQWSTGWWITFICLSGSIITGIIYIGYSYLIHYINKHTED